MENILTRIRKETAPLHKETEALLFPPGTEMGRNEYIFFLQCNAAFHKALEPFIHQAGFSKYPEWMDFDRKKLFKLQNDLKNLGEYEVENSLGGYFQNWTEDQLLGAAYVSEGSSLGGQVMLKQLRKKSFFQEDRFASFLKGYGKSTGKAWENFLHLMEKEGQKDPDAVVDGAVKGFKAFQLVIVDLQEKVKIN